MGDVEVILIIERMGIQFLPWESLWNGNKQKNIIGIGMKTMRIGMKTMRMGVIK